ncbi:MAG: rRNA pseudouridine synthase [Firmicutes bacterium]|nr:rRNA pseudouridine synthase [Bacillota bacterium]MBQ2042105.1 rRNA pseudouridine synthase [Bacillota bacterium]MBQ5415409.1 rRNA pseudouridine synthase [Bacillota bacterium]
MRLNKYIAQAGVCSRRAADDLIKDGRVRINGAVLKEPGYDVQEGDAVVVNGRRLDAPEKLVYYALNKPPGYVTTVKDEKDRPTVMSLLTDVDVRVFPVGRLDYDSCGLLLFTNDGELANRISRPSSHIEKTYLARLNGVPTTEQIWKLRNGIDIEVTEKDKNGNRFTRRYHTKPAIVNMVSQASRECVLEITISEGKNRQIRKMAEAIGLRVLALERTAIGNIRLGRTRQGTYRKLTAEEVKYLKGLK